MNLSVVPIDKPAEMNFILGHSHFIKTVEDVYEAIVQTNPSMKFGVAFCEASGPCLVRFVGNDGVLIALAHKNAMTLAAGHTFIVFMDKGFPVNILNTLKTVPEVCRIYCATANPTTVVLAEHDGGRAILGVVDGASPKGIETAADRAHRIDFLRKIGYKLS
jgi:adenosine/AMP kinase